MRLTRLLLVAPLLGAVNIAEARAPSTGALLENLSSEDTASRLDAVNALGRTADVSHVATLSALLTESEDPVLRDSIQLAVARLELDSGSTPSLAELTELLAEALPSSPQTALWAMTRLAERGDEESWAPVARVIEGGRLDASTQALLISCHDYATDGLSGVLVALRDEEVRTVAWAGDRLRRWPDPVSARLGLEGFLVQVHDEFLRAQVKSNGDPRVKAEYRARWSNSYTIAQEVALQLGSELSRHPWLTAKH